MVRNCLGLSGRGQLTAINMAFAANEQVGTGAQAGNVFHRVKI